MKNLVVAIDGPAGAGKSTIARLLAKELNYIYIDTGAMYRAVTHFIVQNQVTMTDNRAMALALDAIHLELIPRQEGLAVFLNGEDVSAVIRSASVTAQVAAVAQLPAVREKMLHLQREMGQRGGVVMDGRDIGSQVFPQAEVKVFLTASIEERAKRRWAELQAKGESVEFAAICMDIAQRDKMDEEREIAPLIKADGAVEVDTTGMGVDAVLQRLKGLCEERMSNA